MEDWVDTGEPVDDLGMSPLYRAPFESEASSRYRQLAGQRWSVAVRQWQQEHPHADMTVAERRLWLLLCSHGGTPCGWRDPVAAT